VVGDRLPAASEETMRRHRHLGNLLIVGGINLMFGTNYRDILSGYRVFSRRFVQSVPLLTPGFEIETEMTLQALQEGMVIVEYPVSYQSRPDNSFSKLNAFRDGYRIMMTAAILLRDHNPLRIFGFIALISLLAAIGLIPVLFSQWDGSSLGGVVILVSILFLILLSVLTFGTGLLLNAVNTSFRQLKQIIQRNKPYDE